MADAAPYLSGKYVGDAEEIGAIQKRDLANVYDLTVSTNLEDSPEKRYAAKLDDILPNCVISDDDYLSETEDLTGVCETCSGVRFSSLRVARRTTRSLRADYCFSIAFELCPCL